MNGCGRQILALLLLGAGLAACAADDDPTKRPAATTRAALGDPGTAAPTMADSAARGPAAPPWPADPAPGKTECPCYGHGDVDGNGRVTAGDAQRTFAFAIGALSPTPAEGCAADCTGDGALTAEDARRVYAAAIGSGLCPGPLPDGACCEAAAHCASGHCQNGFCCAAGDCCAVAADCPADYGWPPRCDEPADCQGTAGAPTCIGAMCNAALTADDSACGAEVEARDCGPYPAVFCTGAPDQTPPDCADSCTSAADCDPDSECRDGQCVAQCVRHVAATSEEPEPDGLTWKRAFRTVQAGVDAAGAAVEAGAPACAVWVAAGRYGHVPPARVVVALHEHVHVFGGFAGHESALDERDWQANVTILDGLGAAYHVVQGANQATLDGFTVTGGYAMGSFTPLDRGGGMLNLSASPTVANCTFTANVARMAGGAIYSEFGAPRIVDCTFRDNTGSGIYDRYGGSVVERCTFHGHEEAIYSLLASPTVTACAFADNDVGIYTSAGAPTVSDSTFERHATTGLYLAGGSPTVTRCVFRDNAERGINLLGGTTAVRDCTFEGNPIGLRNIGGALTVERCTFRASADIGLSTNGDAPVAVSDSTFADNPGTGLWNSFAPAQVTNCTFRNHGLRAMMVHQSAVAVAFCDFSENPVGLESDGAAPTVYASTFVGHSAGAVVNGNAGTTTLRSSVFRANTAGRGAALQNLQSNATLENCTFSDNVAVAEGGAIYNAGGLSVRNCTFTANGAATGGAVYNVPGAGPLQRFFNTILWGDTPDEFAGSSADLGVFSSDVQGGFPGTGNFDADPRFVDAAAGNLGLEAGSPCIDRADGDQAPTSDAAGHARCDDPETPNAGVGDPPYADVGAYEFLAPGCE